MALPEFQVPVFDALRLTAVGLDVATVQRLGAAGIAARQASRLRALLRAARERSALYRELLPASAPEAGGQIDLAALPVTRKAALMNRFDDWVADPAICLGELRTFLADPDRVGSAFLGRYIVWESSGTSGEPGVFVQDAQAMAVYDALEALRRHTPRPLQRMVDPLYLSERLAFVGATGGHFASIVSLERLRRLNPWLGAAFQTLSIMRPTTELVAELNTFAPTILASYPTAVSMLAEQAQLEALAIRPAEIWTGGETLTAAVRERAEQAFGCSVRDSYGASEFLAMGSECARGRMHANADWVILEPVDERQRRLPPGSASHSVLLTNLANHVQPLIRYDLGDSVRFAAEPCACGSPLPVIEVCGRHDDPLVMQDDAGRRVTWLPLALSTRLEEEAGVFDFQLMQRGPRTLALRVGASGEDAAIALARCSKALHALARRDGLHGLRCIEEPGKPLVRGSSGKVQRVVAL
jgi:phenylacetate-coenzyme A ligase PaaK-like adenylate-forming protein